MLVFPKLKFLWLKSSKNRFFWYFFPVFNYFFAIFDPSAWKFLKNDYVGWFYAKKYIIGIFSKSGRPSAIRLFLQLKISNGQNSMKMLKKKFEKISTNRSICPLYTTKISKFLVHPGRSWNFLKKRQKRGRGTQREGSGGPKKFSKMFFRPGPPPKVLKSPKSLGAENPPYSAIPFD